MLKVKLPPELEQRLDAVARNVGRSKNDIAREAIVRKMQGLEEAFLALDRLNRDEAGFFKLEEMRVRHGPTD